MKRIAIVLAALLAADAANAEFKRLPRRTDVQVAPKPDAKQDVILLPGPETPPPLVLPSPAQRSPSEAAPLIQFTVPPPVATPSPAPAPAAPIAAPAPVPAPAPLAPPAIATPVRAVPTPPSQPIAAPAPASPSPLAVPAPVSPAPVAAPSPVTRPAVVAPAPTTTPPAATPAPVPSPSLATVAVVRPAPPPRAPDTKLIENIFACLAPGLPQDWGKTWIVVTELTDAAAKERRYEAKFFYATLGADDKSEPLTPCNSKEIARQVHGMNDFLAPDKRNWREARLLITHEGRFELKYEYAQ